MANKEKIRKTKKKLWQFLACWMLYRDDSKNKSNFSWFIDDVFVTSIHPCTANSYLMDYISSFYVLCDLILIDMYLMHDYKLINCSVFNLSKFHFKSEGIIYF